eukprot:CAMPEP_0182425414 /NCGR_PEP_ID=MMETSP1167-20130531/11847_1 /TAXON_ID=2988 /ORGANISM="Mallomonas Sp, Strain CCMP3275" /LENGTH=259 /DNA_ID=CAMNT_0024606129 /DNA_START=23 /DNA_END=803 /DNA_ORIENTATION=+
MNGSIFTILVLLVTACAPNSANTDEESPHKKHPIRSNVVASQISEWSPGAVYSPELAAMDPQEYYTKWNAVAFAQDREDLWLYQNMFYGMINGVILESGALDGLEHSTSHFFEKFANWTAVHIEADPLSYDKLLVNRPHSANIHAALCNTSRLLHYTTSHPASAVSGIVEFMSSSHLSQWFPDLASNKTKIDELPVIHCGLVRHLMRHIKLKHVDLWVLDVEGAEESALQGTDFSSIIFDVILLECMNENKETYEEKRV